MKRVAVIIPARYGSSRFPGKVLLNIKSKPLIQWIYEAASESRLSHHVIVATDDHRVHDLVAGFGGRVVLTPRHHRTGSDRCAEVAEGLDVDIVVNLQADELLYDPEMIDQVIDILVKDEHTTMATLKRIIATPEELWNPNVVKVVTDKDDHALYFSRYPIPFARDMMKEHWLTPDAAEYKALLQKKTHFKHIGIYAFTRDFLLLFRSLPVTPLEHLEKLEQLRAIEHGYSIKVEETEAESFRIDTPKDLDNLKGII